MMQTMQHTEPTIKTVWRPYPFDVELTTKVKPRKKDLHSTLLKELTALAQVRRSITVRLLFKHMSKTHPGMGFTERTTRWYLKKCLPNAETRLATAAEIQESYGKNHKGIAVVWIITPLRQQT